LAEIQTLILRNLLQNEDYLRKVIPFLKPEYFEGDHKSVFNKIGSFVAKYNKLPTTEALQIELDDPKFNSIIDSLDKREETNVDWIYDQTEKWCQDRAIYLAIMESIHIIDGKHKTLSKDSLPDLLSKALAVSFDTNIGHDYIDDAESRFRFYHATEEKIPFDLDLMNKITKGGLPKKSLSVALAGCVHPDTKVRIRYKSSG